MKKIGIKLADGSFYPVLDEGAPAERLLALTTAHNNQTKVMVDLYRSESGSMEDAEYVDSLQIDNLIEHPNGEPTLSFTVSIDENNRLSAKMTDPETGLQSNANITLVSRTLEERLLTDEYNISDPTLDGVSLTQTEENSLFGDIDDSGDSPDNPDEDDAGFETLPGDFLENGGDATEAADPAAQDVDVIEEEEMPVDEASIDDAAADEIRDKLVAEPDLESLEEPTVEEDFDFETEDSAVRFSDEIPSFFEGETEAAPVEELADVAQLEEPVAEPDEPAAGSDETIAADETIAEPEEPIAETEETIAETFEAPAESADAFADVPAGTDESIAETFEAPAGIDETPAAPEEPAVVPEEPAAENDAVLPETTDFTADDNASIFEMPESEGDTLMNNDEENKTTDDILGLEAMPDTSAFDEPSLNSGDFATADFSDSETQAQADSLEKGEDILNMDFDLPDVSKITEESDANAANTDLDITSSSLLNNDLPEPDLSFDEIPSETPASSDSTVLSGEETISDTPDFTEEIPDFTAQAETNAADTQETETQQDTLPEMNFPDFGSTDFSSDTASTASDTNSSSLDDFDLPDFNENSTDTAIEPDLDSALDDIDFSDFDDEGKKDITGEQPASKGISFTGLYDKETELGNSAQDEKRSGKTGGAVVICVLCAIICVLATLFILSVVPSKFNLFGKKAKNAAPAAVEQTAEAPAETADAEAAEAAVPAENAAENTAAAAEVPAAEIAEPEPEAPAVPEAKEDEVVVVEEAEKVVPAAPPVTPVKPKDISYKIHWGDTLWDISETYYKNPWRYKYIARYNGIKNPDYIISGTYISIPAVPAE